MKGQSHQALTAVARALAATTDESTRVKLGASASSPPEVLYCLASDPAVTVRAAVAMNPAAPQEVHPALAGDADVRVRALLGRKLAGIAADLNADERTRLERQAIDVLGTLVSDTAVQVRAAIADIVKEMPQAPRDLILKLAQDTAVEVSEPVIRLSPLLTEADLLALLTSPPAAGTVATVARRPQLTEAVSDAIAATADTDAIQLLLANQSAAIREATLDALIASAADKVTWHEPLVRRPFLSPKAARALADIVATQLLDELASRGDLDRALASDLRQRLDARLAAAAPGLPGHGTGPIGDVVRKADELTVEQAEAEARALDRRGELTEEALQSALRNAQLRLAVAILAAAAEVPLKVVDRACTLRSAKGLVSLVWRAGFSMAIAGPLQSVLGRLSPDSVLPAGRAGGFPLAVEEMRWQLDFLGRTPR